MMKGQENVAGIRAAATPSCPPIKALEIMLKNEVR
jgi:hypothetical protein